jgi:putative endonuclease
MARCTSGGPPISPGASGNTNTKVVPGFTTKYGLDRLVWFENHDDREEALRREKQIKGWRRDWKINLIETQNRYWIDLYDNLPGA